MSRKGLQVLALVAVVMAIALPTWAQGGGAASTRLRGIEEVPAISTPGDGRFTATINGQGTGLSSYQLSYSNLQGTVTQAHIHFGQKGVNGGIVIFLCSNLGNGPAGTQACPPSPGSVSGAVTAEDVVAAAAAQGIAPGELGEVLRALRNGVTYVNVHSNLFPSGEIRGQLRFGRGSSGDEALELEETEAEGHIH
ncbi:MAG: hypothetical protein QOH06_1496 [Acidobacteriota bacterium]|jgi:hypothetical protein|nr:hypothetical protein [Acidobacteriota bacterium]